MIGWSLPLPGIRQVVTVYCGAVFLCARQQSRRRARLNVERQMRAIDLALT